MAKLEEKKQEKAWKEEGMDIFYNKNLHWLLLLLKKKVNLRLG